MTQISNPEETKRMVAGMGARLMLSELYQDRDSQRRWLDSELKACDLKLGFNPITKNLLRQVAFSVGEDMTNFAQKAVMERVERILQARVDAMVADDAAFTAAQVAGDTKAAA